MTTNFVENLFGLDGQTVVVVGGTGVLGGALCDGLAKAGAHVVVAGRNQPRGTARVEAIAAAGGKASFVAVDATSRDSFEQLLAAVVTQQGQVDALINCAGINSAKPYLEIEDDDFQKVVETNLLATHLGCQVFAEHMVDAGGGSILNLGSVTSFLPLSRVFAYSASKAAVLNLTKNLAREFAPHKVRVNCLCPGFFPAEQNRKILSEERIENVLRHTPMQRFGKPEELLGAVLLLLSPTAGSFITGTAIYVDGGFTCMTI